MSALLAQRDVFGDTMIELCERDPRVLVLDGDLANSTKSDKLAMARPDRFFMMGIAGQNLAGVAAGPVAHLEFGPVHRRGRQPDLCL